MILALTSSERAWAYGYTRDDDPLLKSFKRAVIAARQSDWPAVDTQIKAVKWQLDELDKELGLDLTPALDKARGSKNSRDVIISWANLVYMALRQKFFWNLKEQLADFNKAKSRLSAARYYYEVVLAGNVRRYDKKRGTAYAKELEGLYSTARSQLGRPSVMGTASVSADPDGFQKTSDRILAILDRIFPYFSKPRAKKSKPGGPK